ncbi:hypothetical protein D3C86_1532180 [compost metagenome]
MGVGVVACGEPLSGATVVAGLIQRHALPLHVGEMLCGLGRTFLVEQVHALLIRPPPQVLEVEGVAGLRQQQQERQAEQPAAATGAGGQQQQRQ